MLTRFVTRDDAEYLFKWRNDPHTIAMSLNSMAVTWNEHIDWLQHSLIDEKKLLILCYLENSAPVGFVRFDVHYHYAEVSINLNPRCRGKGFAKRCLTAALERFQREFRKPTQIIARIKIDNEASQRLFTGAGFSYLRTRDNIAFFMLDLTACPKL
ncbi:MULTISPECIES: GNAT family N-acetyltransferase [unclassified Alteromonas]|uniref:GNAT family N-acetyltransferase n=1 Tax=unclassified Alteromonas TaxID=2614992 RepID=UPI001EF19546|nr:MULTISPECIES: GNAT family N-acetyltransferase [unclassified Alteromonas]MCG7641183.1 GNAT family N-acetyltransferase [Alteromonas sp. MmMcT2-2]|tara:strand:- start:1929 stop:2396 length:468 start_codon:yes stop_codon:yes gene_type:complete